MLLTAFAFLREKSCLVRKGRSKERGVRRKLISVGPSMCPRALSPWCKWPRGPLRHGRLTHGSGTRENQPQLGLRIRRIDISLVQHCAEKKAMAALERAYWAV